LGETVAAPDPKTAADDALKAGVVLPSSMGVVTSRLRLPAEPLGDLLVDAPAPGDIACATACASSAADENSVRPGQERSVKPMENSCGVPGAPNPCAVMLMRDSNMASLPSKPDEVMMSASGGGPRRSFAPFFFSRREQQGER
jgi:hypothetical protein